VALVEGDPGETQSGVQYLDVTSVIGLTGSGEGNVVPHPNLNKTFEAPKHYYFPLPVDQLTLNESLEQNSGW
jgi:hypothetical protein